MNELIKFLGNHVSVIVSTMLIVLVMPLCVKAKTKSRSSERGDIVSFNERARQFWSWFGHNEKKIDEIAANRLEILPGVIQDGLSVFGGDIYFQIGSNREFTFAVEGERERFDLYNQLISMAPEGVKKKWTFVPCRQPNNNDLSWGIGGVEMSAADVKILISKDTEGTKFNLGCFHPAVAGLKSEKDEYMSYLLILEIVLGEVGVSDYVGYIDCLSKPVTGMIPLTELLPVLKKSVEEKGLEYDVKKPAAMTYFRHKPGNGLKLREDMVYGASRLPDLTMNYFEKNNPVYDKLMAFGVEPVFLTVTNPGSLREEDFIVYLKEMGLKCGDITVSGNKICEYVGYSLGERGRGYIDLMLYDKTSFINHLNDVRNMDPVIKNGDVIPDVEVYMQNLKKDSPIVKLR